MKKNDHLVVNSEKKIFMKRQGDDFIIHCLFLDDMMHVPTSDALNTEFMEKYTRYFGMSLSRRSTTGNLFLYNRLPISWRSKMQKTIALSTAEAE